MLDLVDQTIEGLFKEPPELVLEACQDFALALYDQEKPIFQSVGDVEIEKLSLVELVDLRRFLRAQEHFLDHEAEALNILVLRVQTMIAAVVGDLPKLHTPSPFCVPLINLVPDPGELVGGLLGMTVDDEVERYGLFADIGGRLDQNVNAAYKINSAVAPKRKLPSVAEKAGEEGWGPQEVAGKILRGTPFDDFLLTPLPLKFDQETRFSHIHIVGGSGAGKTQLLQNLILHDLKSPEPPTLIVVDSQGDLINKIARLSLFDPDGGPLAGKLTIISPRDINAPPAINIFDVRKDRLDSYAPAMREQVMAGVIQTFDYLFAGLLGADLTAKQSVFFRFVARLMLALPETLGRNATILDMMNLMDDPGPYRDAIKSLPPIQRNFFERDFQATGFKQTKEQIRYRLQAILENPTLERLFTSETTKVDLFSEMNSGGVILIDTAKDFLKGSSAHFGRIFISLVLQAALERSTIPERQRRPAFLIVDEAADYFDDNIDDLLTQVRKYAVGCVFAHQFLDQCAPSLKASLAANTSTKLCASLSVSDARAMAPELRTTAEKILKQKKGHFACFIRNVTPEAVSVPVAFGQLEREPRLDADAYESLLQQNREKVSGDNSENYKSDDDGVADESSNTKSGSTAPLKKSAQKDDVRVVTNASKKQKSKFKTPPDPSDDSATEW